MFFWAVLIGIAVWAVAVIGLVGHPYLRAQMQFERLAALKNQEFAAYKRFDVEAGLAFRAAGEAVFDSGVEWQERARRNLRRLTLGLAGR